MIDTPRSQTAPQPGADIGAEDVALVRERETDANGSRDEASKGAARSGSGSAETANVQSSLTELIEFVRTRWVEKVVGQVDQAEVIERRREDGSLSERYLFMTAMSGGIAVLGLLLSSPAVVIGAMLLSPLMGPIMGLGFALAIGDWDWINSAAARCCWAA